MWTGHVIPTRHCPAYLKLFLRLLPCYNNLPRPTMSNNVTVISCCPTSVTLSATGLLNFQPISWLRFFLWEDFLRICLSLKLLVFCSFLFNSYKLCWVYKSWEKKNWRLPLLIYLVIQLSSSNSWTSKNFFWYIILLTNNPSFWFHYSIYLLSRKYIF